MNVVRLLALSLILASSLCARAEVDAKRLGEETGRFVETRKEKKEGKATANQTAGTFLGIEEGDYAHWKMKTADGEEVSYFILKPDAAVEKVLENPAKFKGRKCRVSWKESVENIPEAGGKTKIQQILSVEWL